VTVSLSVPTDRALCRSYRPPRSRRSRSSMTWRSSCRAWSTCPGAWPRSQLSATRALYRGPEGSGGDLFGCSDTVGTVRLRQFAAETHVSVRNVARPVASATPPARGANGECPAPHKNDRPRPGRIAVFASPSTSGTRLRHAPLRPERAGTLAGHFGAQVELSGGRQDAARSFIDGAPALAAAMSSAEIHSGKGTRTLRPRFKQRTEAAALPRAPPMKVRRREPSRFAWPVGKQLAMPDSSQASVSSALGSQTSGWQDLPGRQTVRRTAAPPRRRSAAAGGPRTSSHRRSSCRPSHPAILTVTTSLPRACPSSM
jgi:hypothetical protein